MTEKRKGRWQAGQSGNPHGRPKGTSDIARLREAISSHMPEIIEQLVTRAKDGDVGAARLLLERTLPSIKPIEANFEFALPYDSGLTGQAEAVARAIASGSLPSVQGTALLAGLTTIARLKEIDEIEERIVKLEQAL